MAATSRSGFVKFFAIWYGLFIFAFGSIANAGTYYVSKSGNNTNLGTAPGGSAWRTIAYAASKAKSGDTIYIEGGDYGNEKVVVANSGTSAAPIVFEGYNGTPVLNRGSRVTTNDYSSIGFSLVGKKYVTLRNINATLYFSCFQLQSCSYITLENVKAYACGWEVAYGYGIVLIDSNHCTIKNCTVTDCGGNDFCLNRSDYNTLENCQAIGTLSSSNKFATDYYMVFSFSSYNTFKNCVSDDTTRTGKGNHGIGIKDQGTSSHGYSTANQFIDCKAYSMEEGIYCAYPAYGNTFTNCIGDYKNKFDPFSNGLMVRDGAHDNLFVNCRGIAAGEALCIYASNETTPHAITKKNKFVDCIFEAKERIPLMGAGYEHPVACMYFRNAQDNTFENCSLVNGKSIFRFGYDKGTKTDLNSGNTFTRCTIYNTQNFYDTQSLGGAWNYNSTTKYAGYNDMADITWISCNFWQNGFATPSGQSSYRPHFADPSTGDYHVLKNAAKSWTVWQ